MLLEFRCKNFKTFREECVFSMVPAPRQKGLDYSILSRTIDGKEYKALCSSVIYGPNAAGKSNLISAMDTMRLVTLAGHIKNRQAGNTRNAAAFQLELCPNREAAVGEPVYFYVKFIVGEMLFEYAFGMDVGGLCVMPYERKIVSESLKINGSLIFERNEKNLQFPSKTKNDLVKAVSQKTLTSIRKNLSPVDLFLMNGFKSTVDSKIAGLALSWFERKFTPMFAFDQLLIRPDGLGKNETMAMPAFEDEALKEFGVCDHSILYYKGNENEPAQIVSAVKTPRGMVSLVAEVFESCGTLHFFNLLPCLLDALQKGKVLIFDEMDVSLHPAVVLSIINVFHNDEINTRGAQLIFNTHNPVFLDGEYFRRDEIKFVDRCLEENGSDLYRLSDFGTREKGGRKMDSYMKNYSVNRYGAIRNVDLSRLFEKAMAGIEK